MAGLPNESGVCMVVGIMSSEVAQSSFLGLPLEAFWAICAVLAGFVAAQLAARVIRMTLGKTSVGDTSVIVNVVRAAVLFSVIYFLGENVFHIELGGIAQALGVTTLVVTIGLQDLLKNAVAGIQIVLSRLFSVGDHIEVGGERGEVIDIGWRQTIMRDKDGNPHVIPNAQLMSGAFVRLDGKMTSRYLFTCDIKPGLDLDRVAEDIVRLSNEALDANGWRAEESTEVRFLGSTANGVVASVRIYLTDIELATRGMDAVMRAIAQRGYLADWTNESEAQEQWR